MDGKVLRIRPDIKNPGLIKNLQELADKKKVTLNKYVVALLAKHVKTKKK